MAYHKNIHANSRSLEVTGGQKEVKKGHRLFTLTTTPRDVFFFYICQDDRRALRKKNKTSSGVIKGQWRSKEVKRGQKWSKEVKNLAN